MSKLLASKTHAVILYDKTLYAEDAAVVERILSNARFERISHIDIREPHVQCDVQVHVRIPIYSAVSWAHKNIMLKHPAQWVPAYDAYLHAFDVYDLSENPWCSWMKPSVPNGVRDVGCFITNEAMFEYVQRVLPYWQKDDPHLTVYGTPAQVKAIVARDHVNVTAVESNQDMMERCYALHMAHLVCSQENMVNYSALHSLAAGAFVIANALPYYKGLFKSGVAWLTNEYDDSRRAAPTSNIRRELESAFFAYSAWENKKKGKDLLDAVYEQIEPMLRFSAKPMLGTPVLAVKDCPPITVITPTYNRKGLIDIAMHNMLSTDYPKDKMEWIIVEDNEQKDQMATDKIINFQVNHPTISIKYIPIEGRVSIGEKRNYGVKHATHNIILFMDDDDHCPITAFRRRVAWLLHSDRDIVCCTTLPLYDLKTGTSAVSIPPFELPLSQRVSEATLTFTKEMWVERPFPDVSLAEGESWIQGREAKVVEIPPQQIIVAFTHGANQSSRIVPNGGNVSCFWGFPDEYLHFIHGLAGVKIVKQ
jgi:hypothetical protein